MSREESDLSANLEPACWGSGEAPLIPPQLRKLCGVTQLGEIEGRRTRYGVLLATFCSAAWRRSIGDVAKKKMSASILDMVVDGVEALYQQDSLRFDIPAADIRLNGFVNLAGLPFEVETWKRLVDAGASRDLDVYVLLTGSFREVRERLGDMRAALDFVVTANEWIVTNDNGGGQVLEHHQPDSLEVAGLMARVRAYRCRGLSPHTSAYSARFANVLGLRFGVGVADRWTLDECAVLLGITRERVRQLADKALWSNGLRRWGPCPLLDELYEALLDETSDVVTLMSTGESMGRADGIALLESFGYLMEEFDEPWSVADELAEHGIKLYMLQRFVYQESERLGFMTLTELEYHLRDRYPELDGEMFDEIVAELVAIPNLPHDYVYVEAYGASYFKGWMTKLLSVLGPQSLDEAYLAAERACRVRIPRLVFPPRSVIEAFFDRSSEFWFADGFVGLVAPTEAELAPVEQWVNDAIMGCTGHVIHRTELWDKARRDGKKPGTLNVYTNYSLFVKPVGRGCVTVTGLQPTDLAIDLASSRARAIDMSTVINSVRSENGCVLVEVEVGNELLDSGLLRSRKEMRDMMKNQDFRVMTDTGQAGNIHWSGNVMTGFTSSLNRLQIQPGDTVLLRFSIVDSELTIEPLSDVVD